MQILHLLNDVRVRFFTLPWSWNLKHTWMLLLSDTLQTWRLFSGGALRTVKRINLILLEFFIDEFISVLQFKLVVDYTEVNEVVFAQKSYIKLFGCYPSQMISLYSLLLLNEVTLKLSNNGWYRGEEIRNDLFIPIPRVNWFASKWHNEEMLSYLVKLL